MPESADLGPEKPDPESVTRLLLELREGDSRAMAKLMPLVYAELRRLAGHYMRQERNTHTLQPTALVHEVYLRLVSQADRNWQNRAHFFAVSAQAMRAVLVDHARANLAQKRGGGEARVPLTDALEIKLPEPQQLLALDQALNRLEQVDARAARVVELRWFTGLGVKEAAQVMGISEKTLQRDWNFAKAWLQSEIEGG